MISFSMLFSLFISLLKFFVSSTVIFCFVLFSLTTTLLHSSETTSTPKGSRLYRGLSLNPLIDRLLFSYSFTKIGSSTYSIVSSPKNNLSIFSSKKVSFGFLNKLKFLNSLISVVKSSIPSPREELVFILLYSS